LLPNLILMDIEMPQTNGIEAMPAAEAEQDGQEHSRRPVDNAR